MASTSVLPPEPWGHSRGSVGSAVNDVTPAPGLRPHLRPPPSTQAAARARQMIPDLLSKPLLCSISPPARGGFFFWGGLCPVGGLREAERSGLSRDLPPTALHLSVKLQGGPTCPPCFLFQSQFLAVVSIFNDFFKQPACGLSENLNSPPQRVPFYSHSVLLPTR